MKEKSQIEKNAEERQIELLSTALNEASNAGYHWLNAAGKGFPKFYPRGVAVSPFNGLFMALHSDRNGCKTNLFTLYSDAKARGTSVREHEQGVPFLFYNWNKYVHRNNPEDIISRDAYLKLDEEVQKQYKGIHNREIRTLFNIDQTTLPYVDKEEYDMVLLKDGSAVERGYSEYRRTAIAYPFQRLPAENAGQSRARAFGRKRNAPLRDRPRCGLYAAPTGFPDTTTIMYRRHCGKS